MQRNVVTCAILALSALLLGTSTRAHAKWTHCNVYPGISCYPSNTPSNFMRWGGLTPPSKGHTRLYCPIQRLVHAGYDEQNHSNLYAATFHFSNYGSDLYYYAKNEVKICAKNYQDPSAPPTCTTWKSLPIAQGAAKVRFASSDLSGIRSVSYQHNLYAIIDLQQHPGHGLPILWDYRIYWDE